MVNLAIRNKPITRIPLDDGSEVWDLPVFQKAHRDNQGSWIGLRKSLLDIALKRKVKLLNIKIKDLGIEFEVEPVKFIAKAKIIDMPSKYGGIFEIYLYPISDIIINRAKRSQKINLNLCQKEYTKEQKKPRGK